MSEKALINTDWQTVSASHPLESLDPAEWVRYGLALSQLIEPTSQSRQQQQQAGLAFAHAVELGAHKEAVALSQRLSTLLSLVKSLELAEVGSGAEWLSTKARRLDRMSQGLIQREVGTKSTIRTLHHLACTGGTVISKCLASMPDVALVSEVNPLNRFGGKFEPTNPLLLLERSYRELSMEEIKEDFLGQIAQAVKICIKDGADLVIRDHSHTDFCRGDVPAAITPILDFLRDDYTLISAITVRHPLDSYLGLVAQGWHQQFIPSNLEEYARRYLKFLDRYEGLPLMKYEDFCMDPDSFLQQLCATLHLDYSPNYRHLFGRVRLSGDSGRGSNTEIRLRERRPMPAEVEVDARKSESLYSLLDRLGYHSDPDRRYQ
ncbi:MAG: hypothetical protein ER33_10690 [Cyanobium sp. CACIAM 14]|nr:MAG: hypothetical protein ER33_10690 [Cyanobium sp. CACIAM 14]